ncbi:undecaprenyl-phosphate glucose phosphotransferase [Oceanidesulfovibrio indonesiensis]|uniref:Undecaprenyl-phosphate glucose phosphotransferase n=1 Tax=Oceanidesulfovibrio indonesiensis TaxID=54767 RepID=A0A7M3MIH5_9BACT|nr:undecaprenyl-phosphate glucose phosphotransferase [Oceanidesulfovibrio indonesiensis]TVM19498.1 undecaprenyl-phosphate glucose phosphotransferase [Oceanidesulfovibrio indonesiensis]
MNRIDNPYQHLAYSALQVADAILAGGLFLAFWKLDVIPQTAQTEYEALTLLIAFATPACMSLAGAYRGWRTGGILPELRSVLTGCIFLFISLAVAGALLKINHVYSRIIVGEWFVTWVGLLVTTRVAMRLALRLVRRNGRNTRTALIVGAGTTGRRISEAIARQPGLGIRVVGLLDDNKTEPVDGVPILGSTMETLAHVNAMKVDIVYIALPMRKEKKIKRLVGALTDTTASVYIAPDMFSYGLLLSGQMDYLGGNPTIALWESPFHGVSSVIKRVSDIVLSSTILLLISPIMLGIALAVKLSSRGPVFFVQWRYGLNGEPIRVFKFRTMRVMEDGYEFVQATKDDPRVTRVGAFLRKTSLDELPQFINVLLGTMSVVGPRPHAVAMNEEYRKLISGYMLRHKIKPGITGLAQINGYRGETDTVDKMEGRVRFDLEYIRKWSLLLDLIIIGKTIRHCVSSPEAY